jgi:hypothetical protein
VDGDGSFHHVISGFTDFMGSGPPRALVRLLKTMLLFSGNSQASEEEENITAFSGLLQQQVEALPIGISLLSTSFSFLSYMQIGPAI